LHEIQAVVDPHGEIAESDEGNNLFVTSLLVADESSTGRASSGRQYNLHGVPDLGDGQFGEIDAICEFTPYIEVQVRYGGHLNDVGIAYERNGAVDQSISYGPSGNYVARLVNPNGKIHIQATKWSGDNSNGKVITVTVKNCYGKVLYEGQSTDNVFDVFLSMKGCDAEEFAAWMAVNGPQE
jgi:hypothetical protein